MTAIDDALAALTSIIRADFDPSPQPAPLWVVNYPLEYEMLERNLADRALPGIVVNDAVNIQNDWSIKATGRGMHRWVIEVTCLLMAGDLTSDKQAAQAAQMHRPYFKAMADLLYSNMKLNGTVAGIGEGQGGGEFRLMSYRAGHAPWWRKNHWGVVYMVPVYQVHNQTMSA